MISYTAEHVFDPRTLHALRHAERVVEWLPQRPIGLPWRCHEVARIVAAVLGGGCEIVDGKYGPVEHTWLLLRDASRHGVILDPYAVGRLPQVQAVWAWLNLADLYTPGPQRTDVDEHLVVDTARRYARRHEGVEIHQHLHDAAW